MNFKMEPWMITLTGAAGVALTNWYFFGGRGKAATAPGNEGAVNIVVEGGYSPAVIKAKPGEKLRLVFDRREKSPCSDEIVLSDFGIRRFLKPFGKTAIETPALKPGTYEFTCGMNMLRGRIEVEA